ncbi:putative reverse transcriptase domain-containing protein, partial [Tanacetum coccineum]
MITNNNRTRGRTLVRLTLQGLVRRNLTEDLNLYAPNETITMMVSVLKNAISQKATCFECGAQGYFKRECPKLKNNNRGNQGADRRFMSTAFSSKIDITPTTLDHYYDVELADRRIIGLNT